MEWIEIIRLRGETPPEQTPLSDELYELFRRADASGLQQYNICTSLDERDLLVILTWDTAFSPKTGRSHLGGIAAVEMGRYGLVDHSVWRLIINTDNDA